MMVFQMTTAASVINNVLHTPTCDFFFFIQKRCISENMVYLYKLSMTVVRIILVPYTVWNSCVNLLTH